MRFLILSAAMVTSFVGRASAIDITTCYQTIHAHEVGSLQANLTCDGTGGPDVTLQPGATLELNGLAISGGYLGVGIDPGDRLTVIHGPGEIVSIAGAGPIAGCAVGSGSPLLIDSAYIHDNDCGVVAEYTRSVFLYNVRILDNAGDGVRFTQPVKHGKVDARYTTIAGNGGNGISAYRSVILRNVTVTGNGGAGVVTERHMTLKDSASVGNGPSGDLASFFHPHLKNTLCDHSVDLDGGTFGVCSLD